MLIGTSASALTGNGLANNMTGNALANTIDGGGGADRMVGSPGNDTYIVNSTGDQVLESSVGGIDTVRAYYSHTLAVWVENLVLIGTSASSLTGNTLDNTITGNNRANTITGNAGADAFVFNTAIGASNIDTITDFAVGVDELRLDNAIFTAIGPNSALNADAFHIGAAADDAEDRTIYNDATGALLYDADGSGAGAAIQFATLSDALALTSDDLRVI